MKSFAPALALLIGLQGIAHAADTEWPSYNNGLDSQRYSTLDQINAGNVKSLAQVCSLKIADAGAFQAGPLVIDGIIYVTAPTTTVAIDATNCAEKWRTNYTPTGPVAVPVNRGAAFLDGKLFRGTVDGKLQAMNAADGRVLWLGAVTD